MQNTLAYCKKFKELESLHQIARLAFAEIVSDCGDAQECNLILNKNEDLDDETKCSLYIRQGDHDKAKKCFLRAMGYYEKETKDYPINKYYYAHFLTGLAIFFVDNNYEKALRWFLRAHEIYNEIYGVDFRVHKSHLANSSSLVGYIYLCLDDEEKSKSYFDDSLAYCDAENELDEIDKDNLLSSYMRMLVAANNGVNLPTREIITQLYSLHYDFSKQTKFGQTCSLADVYYYDGFQYLLENNADMASEMLEKSIAQYEKENKCEGLLYASACDNLGRAMMRKHNFGRALDHINRAIQLFEQYEQYNVDIQIIGATNAKIVCLLNLDELTAADFHIQKNFNKLSSIGESDTWVYHKEKAALYEATAIYYQLTQKPAEAIQQLDEAIKEASVIGNEQFISSFQQRKKEIQESMKQ